MRRATSTRLAASFETILPSSLTSLSPAPLSFTLTLIRPSFCAYNAAASSAAIFVFAWRPAIDTVPPEACTALLSFVPSTSISVIAEISVVPPVVRIPHADWSGTAEVVSFTKSFSFFALISSVLPSFVIAAASLTLAVLPPLLIVSSRSAASI